MKQYITSFALILFSLLAMQAHSSVITYENRKTNNGVDKTNYIDSWNNQSSVIRSRSLDSFTNLRALGPRRHQHSHLSISFEVSSAFSGLNWLFQFSPDAGLGGEFYFDGALVDRDTSNLWWGKRWHRESELLTANILGLGAGTHTIDLYWAENCCNGGQSGRFSLDNGQSWLALSTENLDSVAVPEPGNLALLGIGIAGLFIARRKIK